MSPTILVLQINWDFPQNSKKRIQFFPIQTLVSYKGQKNKRDPNLLHRTTAFKDREFQFLISTSQNITHVFHVHILFQMLLKGLLLLLLVVCLFSSGLANSSQYENQDQLSADDDNNNLQLDFHRVMTS